METPVLIVGAGPSGATTTLLLARLGVKSLVISRHRGTANTPRAHIFNQRVMEVLRDAGIEERCYSSASSSKHMEHSSFLVSLAGEEYGRLWAWGNKSAEKGAYESASPCSMSDLPQSLLEPILIYEARKLGAEFVFSTDLQCAYKSDLSKYIAHRPRSLNWILNPEAPDWSAVGNFRMVYPWNEWVVSMHPANKEDKRSIVNEDDILERLHQMIGESSTPIQILSTYQWTINNQVAREWQSGRVLCIGDATHRHPPINRLGSNTCISDAFNFAWKLAYVIKGLANAALLDSLTPERKPVGDGVVKRANAGMGVQRNLWEVIGLTQETRREALRLLSADTPEGQQKRKDWSEALEAVDNEVQALGIQMNQVYTNSSAVLTEHDDVSPDFRNLNPVKDVMISTYPGYHLSHVWLVRYIAGHGRFAIFTGIGGEGWVSAAARISVAVPGLKIFTCKIGPGCDFIDCYREWRGTRSGGGCSNPCEAGPLHCVALRPPSRK
ncbi:putative FAD dependent oxidoreductase [Xylogone sp. PMI_703]|nr:putative FAD dependent oxidoreductase [Xylogone sp. PMI_703]